ncbi:ABC transporter ATP-binding protein [Bacillus sp. NPDC077027]|uniref:ABC transporter ATP-binding protein n=1 Tax=Bacillus sp. NPDC077027 TaxID=3390548 RepID=UPI003CFD2E09
MINVVQVYGGYGQKDVIQNISFSVKPGEFLGILGPNGSGKSTLLKMISGIMTPKSGSIWLDGCPLQSYHSKKLAKKLAVLPQKTDQAFSFTVEETVQFGRYPYHKGLFQTLTDADHRMINQFMKQTDIERFREQSIHELSGGEQQRVYLAQALAQEPDYLLLDEPTSFLDLAYQKNLLDLMKEETVNSQLAVIGVFHDVNVASLYCDRLLLLNEGKGEVLDRPESVLSAKRIGDIYETSVTELSHPERANPQFTIDAIRFPKVIERRSWEDGLTTIGADGLLFSIDQPLRILSSSSGSGGFFWKRALGTGVHFSKWERQIPYKSEEMWFVQQKGGIHQHVSDFDQDNLCIIGMRNGKGELAVWVMLNSYITEGTFVQLLSFVMQTIQAYMQIKVDHICVASTQCDQQRNNASDSQLFPSIQRKMIHVLDQLCST